MSDDNDYDAITADEPAPGTPPDIEDDLPEDLDCDVTYPDEQEQA